MRAKEYPLLVDCLEVAARRTTNRVLKHGGEVVDLRDPAVQGQVEEAFVQAALTEVCERFDLDPEPEVGSEEFFERLLAYLKGKVGKGQPSKDGQEDDEQEPR